MPRLRVLTCAALVLAAGGCGSVSQSSTGSTTLTIYSSLPLQGSGSQRSQDIVDGEKLALAQAGGQVGPFTVNFRSLDDSTAMGRWEPGATVDAARAAASDRNAIAYIGDVDAGATALSLPVLNSAGVLQVSPGTTYGGLTSRQGAGEGEPERYYPSGHQTFARLVPPDGVQATAIAQLMSASHCRRVAVFTARDAFEGSLGRLLAAAIRAAGMPIVFAGEVAGDVRARVKAAAGAGAGRADCATFAAELDDDPAGMYRALHDADPGIRLIAPMALADPTFAAALGPAESSTTVLGPAPPPRLLGPLALKFAGDFKHAYSRAPGQWAILGYEAMRAVLFAIQRAGQRGNDRTVVTNRFLALRARRSALGTYSMEPTGDSTLDDLAAYRVRTGALAFERTVRGGSQGA